MLYRIRIMKEVDGKLEFDHYATDEEMRFLRITPDGMVEKISCLPYNSGDAYDSYIFFDYDDVSATHFVEWGVSHDGIDLYDGDIVTAPYYLFQDEGKYNYHGLIYYDEESYCIGLRYVCVNKEKRGISDGIGNLLEEYHGLILLGNIWQNPELVEEK